MLLTPVAALLIMSRDQNVKNINTRMTSFVYQWCDATYNQKPTKPHLTWVFSSYCCWMLMLWNGVWHSVCEPLVRSSDKSEKPARGWNQVKHSLQLPRNGVRRSWYQYWSWQSWPWWSQWSWWSWHQYWAMVLQAKTTTRQATGPVYISITPPMFEV
jgi:hypothetical protein